MTRAIFDPRQKSLARGNLLVLGSVVATVLLSHFPQVRPDLWIILPAAVALVGTVDTVRNVRERWSFYHAAVILCIYMDLMAIFLVLFFLFYPYVDLGAHRLY